MINDVDLFLAQLVLNGPDSLTQFANTGAFGVEPRLQSANSDFGAVAGFSGHRGDLHRAFVNLGNLQGKQAAHQTRVGSTHRNGGALQALFHLGDIDPQARTVFINFTGDLLLRGKNRFNLTQVDVDHAGVWSLGHNSRDNIAVFATIFAKNPVIADVAQALIDDLLRCVSGNATEIFWTIDLFARFFAFLVEDWRVNDDVTSLAV